MWFRLLGKRNQPPFNPLERRILQELEQRLSPDARALLHAQVERVTSIHRHDREVLCYPTIKGQPYYDPEIRFPNDAEECKLATMKFRLPPLAGVWKTDLFAINEHFFMFVFSPKPPRRKADEPIEIEEVKLHDDPMKPAIRIETPVEPADPQQFTGWLQEWVRHYHVSNAPKPLPADQKDLLLKRISARLPDDYLQLIEQCEGLIVNDCAILGLSEVYSVTPCHGDYYVLADCRGEGWLAVRAESEDGTVYFMASNSSSPVNAGKSLREAVERRCIRDGKQSS